MSNAYCRTNLTKQVGAHKGQNSRNDEWRISKCEFLLCEIHKIFQQLQTDGLAFLRMKLRSEYVVLPNRRCKGVAVSRARGDNGIIQRLRKKAVDEIYVAAVGNIFKQWTIRLRDVDLVPADLRNFQSGLFRKSSNFAFENIQSRRAAVELLALLE